MTGSKFDDNVRGVGESKLFSTTDTVYPRPASLEPFDPIPADGVFFLAPISVPLHFATRTSHSWRKPYRTIKKHRKMARARRRKEIRRLQNAAYGYPVFRCAQCGKAMIGGATLAECKAQFEDEFPGEPFFPGRMDTVCDPCFQEVASPEKREARRNR